MSFHKEKAEGELRNLKSAVESLTSDRAALEETINSLKDEFNGQEKELVAQLQASCSELTLVKASLDALESSSREKISAYVNEIASFKLEVDDKVKLIASLRANQESGGAALTAAEEEVQSLRSQLQTLQVEHESVKQTSDTKVASLEKTIADMQVAMERNDLREKETEESLQTSFFKIHELRTKLDAMSLTAKEANDGKAKVESQLRVLQSSLDGVTITARDFGDAKVALESAKSALESQVADLTSKLEASEYEMREFKAALEFSIKSTNDEKEVMRVKLQEATGTIATLKENVTRLDAEISSIQLEKAALENQMDLDRKAAAEELESMRTSSHQNISALQEDLQGLHASLGASESEKVAAIAAVKKDVERLQKDLDYVSEEKQQAVAKLEVMRDELLSNSTALSNVKDDLSAAEVRMDDLKAQHAAKIKVLTDERQTLEEKMALVCREGEEMEREYKRNLELSEVKIAKLQLALESAAEAFKEQMEAVHDNLNKVKVDYERLQQNAFSAAGRETELNEMLIKSQLEVNELKSSLALTQTALDKSSAEGNQATARHEGEVKALNERLVVAEREMTEFKSALEYSLTVSNEEIRGLKSSVIQMEKDLSRSSDTITSLSLREKDLLKSLELLQGENAGLKEEVEAINKSSDEEFENFRAASNNMRKLLEDGTIKSCVLNVHLITPPTFNP